MNRILINGFFYFLAILFYMAFDTIFYGVFAYSLEVSAAIFVVLLFLIKQASFFKIIFPVLILSPFGFFGSLMILFIMSNIGSEKKGFMSIFETVFLKNDYWYRFFTPLLVAVLLFVFLRFYLSSSTFFRPPSK